MRTGVLVAIAAGLIGLGVLLGFVPGSAQGANKEFSCGSPWNMDAKAIRDQEYLADLGNSLSGPDLWTKDYRERCEDELGTRGVFAWILTGLGVAALIGVAIARRPAEPAPAEKPSAQPGE